VAEERLLDVAAAVLDGTALDWERVSQDLDADERRVLEQLRVLPRCGATARSEAAGSGTTWLHLRLLRRLGSGGYGEVWRAWDTQLDREVALKLLPSDGEEGAHALAEARLLARVRHPGVVGVHGAASSEGRSGIWMERVPGATLADLVREHGPFDAETAAAVGVEVCRALAAVHRAGLVHGDVKADNVMREPAGRVVLLDFGLGRRVELGDERFAGSLEYVAPERLLLGAPTSVATDVYSVGVLLFHLATGAFPVSAGSTPEVADRHRRGLRVSLGEARPQLPPAFVDAVDRALSPRAEDRPASAAALGALLDRERPQRPQRPRALLLLALAAAFLGVAFLWTLRPSPAPRSGERVSSPLPIRATFEPPPPPVASPVLGSTASAGDPFVRPLGEPGSALPALAGDPAIPYLVTARLAGGPERPRLELTASRPLAVYVLGIAADRVWLLYPIPPRDGAGARWTPAAQRFTTSLVWRPPERVETVIVASPASAIDFEQRVRALRVPEAARLQRVPLEPALLALLPGLEDTSAIGRPLALARPLSRHAEGVRGPWIRRLPR
jgi:serine/threonine-protein kinase